MNVGHSIKTAMKKNAAKQASGGVRRRSARAKLVPPPARGSGMGSPEHTARTLVGLLTVNFATGDAPDGPAHLANRQRHRAAGCPQRTGFL